MTQEGGIAYNFVMFIVFIIRFIMDVSDMAIIYLMHGGVGAGKTTEAKKLEKRTGSIRYTSDEIIAEQQGNSFQLPQDSSYWNTKVKVEIWDKVASIHAINEDDVILDFGFQVRATPSGLEFPHGRDAARQRVIDLGFEPVFVEVLCDINIRKERALARGLNNVAGEIHIDEETFDRLALRFQPLEEDERSQTRVITIDTNPT